MKENTPNDDDYLTKRTLSVANIKERARDNQQIKDSFQKLRT